MGGRMDGYELGPFWPRWTSRGRRPVHGAGPGAPTPRRPCPPTRPCAVRAMRLRPAPAWGARAAAEGRPRRRSEAPPHTRARSPVEACLTQPRATAECVRAAPCARAGRAPQGGGAAWCHLDHTKGAAPPWRLPARRPTRAREEFVKGGVERTTLSEMPAPGCVVYGNFRAHRFEKVRPDPKSILSSLSKGYYPLL